MKLFGSGITFYGGPGESAHKQFIKIPGQRTQHRVSEFAQQTALQYYNMLVSSHAARSDPIFTNSCVFKFVSNQCSSSICNLCLFEFRFLFR